MLEDSQIISAKSYLTGLYPF